MAVLSLPNPKVSPQEKNPKWYRFYAMFSEEFARKALAEAKLHRTASIMDPWVGVGTATAVSAVAGHKTIGIDINPVMVTISRGRSTPQATASTGLSRVLDNLNSVRRSMTDDPLLDWFRPGAARQIRRWAEAIRSENSGEIEEDAAAFMFTSLFEAAYRLASSYRSKNPTWIKQPAPNARIDASPSEIKQLIVTAANYKLRLCPEVAPLHKPRMIQGNSRATGIATGSVDFVLTSPPYCTRIDYAMATRLELAILSPSECSLALLRERTMGSSTIRASIAKPDTGWGTSCLNFLDAVAQHPSKGSANYYLKTFTQYFDDLYVSLIEIGRCLRNGGRIALVVQDSFYKGIRADLPQICEEIGRQLGWDLVARQDILVVRSMRCVNTRSRQYGGDAPKESVLWFVKNETVRGSRNYAK